MSYSEDCPQGMSYTSDGETRDSLLANVEKYNDALTRFVIMDGLPFSLVNHLGFSSLVNYIQPEYSLPSPSGIAQQFISMYASEKEKLKKKFESLRGCVSIAMSSWSDVTTLEYVCLAAHYVDSDWKLRKKIINFRLTSLKEPDFSESLILCLRRWRIKRLFSMTLDNSLAKVITPLKLKSKLDAFFEPRSELHHNPCHADIFKLLTREGLDSIGSTLERLRDAIMYTQGFERESKFYCMAEKLKVDTNKKLFLDIPVLWHSTYLMLENTFRYREVFVRLESVDSNFTMKPTQEDWIKVRSLCKFLKLYYKAAKLFSDRRTTADMYFFASWKICMHLKKESKNSDPFVSSLAT